jgi:hypothetical protein
MKATALKLALMVFALALAACQQPPAEDLKRKYI